MVVHSVMRNRSEIVMGMIDRCCRGRQGGPDGSISKMHGVSHELIESQQHKHIEYKLRHTYEALLTEYDINCDNLPTSSILVVFFQTPGLLGSAASRVAIFILANSGVLGCANLA